MSIAESGSTEPMEKLGSELVPGGCGVADEKVGEPVECLTVHTHLGKIELLR